jgi:[acyl-carrier-protein] S-malonyltransferase
VDDADCELSLSGGRAGRMRRCAEQAPGGMLAVAGLDDEAIEQLCTSAGVALAIRIGASNVVLGGPNKRLDQAERAAANLGARCTRLRIGVASHTPWMRQAAEDFLRTLIGCSLQRAAHHPVQRCHDRVRRPSAKEPLSCRSLPPPLGRIMDNIHARRVNWFWRTVVFLGTYVENEALPDVPARSCDEFRSAAGIAKWVVGLTGVGPLFE